MGKTFLLQDFIEIAMEMERSGYEYYMQLANKMSDSVSKQIFIKFAEDEKEHAELFSRLVPETRNVIVRDLDSVYLEHLLKKSNTNQLKTEEQERAFDPLQAIRIGIEKEKESILFYHELLANVNDIQVKELLAKFLKEEKLHLVDLRDYEEEYS